jgi:uncharacterized NAD(P)/FAD-binding protein YdhS/uncharacterized protein YjbI with pentapeptide repeats
MPGFKDNWGNILGALSDDLNKLYTKCGPWDVIFFTGDLVYQGTKEEFIRLDEILEDILEKIKKLGANPVVLVIPGNHDLQRPNDDIAANISMLKAWDKNPHIHEVVWNDKNSEYHIPIQKAFENYNEWWEKYMLSTNKKIKFERGIVPGDFSCTLDINDIKVGIAGINTAMLQLGKGDYKEKLAVDVSQLNKVCDGNVPEWINKHSFCFLLTHHGSDWLDENSKQQMEREINPAGRFSLHLFGHMHEPLHSDHATNGADLVRSRQGASLFGLEKYIDYQNGKTKENRTHGYSAGIISITENKATIREWPRIAADPKQGWRLIADTNNFSNLMGDDGTKAINIEINKGDFPTQDMPTSNNKSDASKDTIPPQKPIIDSLPPKFSDDNSPKVAIVGSGFAGTITAIRILQFARKKLNIVIVHDKLDEKYGGLAYGHSTLGDYHYLNIQAGRLSLFREDPFDFMKWANEYAGTFTEFTAVRRKVYGDYIKQRFTEAKEQSKNVVEIRECYGKVIDITEDNDSSDIELNILDLSNGSLSQVSVDQVILATGHEQPIVPSSISETTKQHSYFFSSPFDKKIEQLKSFLAEKKICILGTGLTAYDAALKLKDLGFKGKISLYSRNGLTHGQYAPEHSHDSIPIPLPEVEKNPSNADLEKEFLNVLNKGKKFLKDYHGIEENSFAEERTLKAMEPWISGLIDKSDASSVAPFLQKLKSFLTTNRTSVVSEVGHEIEELKLSEAPSLTIEKNFDIITVEKFKENQFIVIAKKDNQLSTTNFDAVIVCMGWESDYEKVDSIVWKLLMEKGIAQPQKKTKLGIEVNKFGELIGEEKTSRNILAVGPMRQGDEMARRGRVGAFVYSIGTIRNQAVFTALRVLQHIESRELIELDLDTKKHVQEELIKRIDSNNSSEEAISCYKKLCNQIKDTQFHPRYDNFEYLNKRLQANLEAPILTNIYDEIYHNLPSNLVINMSKFQAIQKHMVWYLALFKAAEKITDISRLASGYNKVRTFKDRKSNSYSHQQAICVDTIKQIAIELDAISGSILVCRDDGRLTPFSRFRRIDKFTPTNYQPDKKEEKKAVNGHIIEYYSKCSEFPIPKESIVTYSFDSSNTLDCAVINNYNKLPIEYKKENYENEDRKYPTVIIAPLVKNEKPMGILYLEAKLEREFCKDDAKKLVDFINNNQALIDIVQKATTSDWSGHISTDWRDGDLSDADLADQDLDNYNFTNANLINTRFQKARLKKVKFNAADCRGANFEKAKMQSSKLISSCLINSNFKGADLRAAELIHADLSGSDFTNAKMDAVATIKLANFTRAKLINITLSDISVKGVNFSGTEFKGSTLTRLKNVKEAIWDNVNLTGAKISENIFRELDQEIQDEFKDSVTLI